MHQSSQTHISAHSSKLNMSLGMLFHKVCESHNTRLGFTSHYFQLRHLTLYLSYSSRIRGTCWKSITNFTTSRLDLLSRQKASCFWWFSGGFPFIGECPIMPWTDLKGKENCCKTMGIPVKRSDASRVSPLHLKVCYSESLFRLGD